MAVILLALGELTALDRLTVLITVKEPEIGSGYHIFRFFMVYHDVIYSYITIGTVIIVLIFDTYRGLPKKRSPPFPKLK